MARSIDYSTLSVLIADDFSSFRHTVSSMLSQLGVQRIELACDAKEAIQWCERKFFDLVLCDYTLGGGRTGQHVLEELRFRKLITRQTLFIIVSAESSRTIVMSAYDCEPDDFLMKPINGRMLQQRMERLLRQRTLLWPAHRAMAEDDWSKAADLLVDLSLGDHRHVVAAQKLLGTVFVQLGELDKAERLYARALEVRQLDWARLGLAKVKQARGELDIAGSWLTKIVDDNPLYLPAYDSLAENWAQKGDQRNVQTTVEKAVAISPLSILRQKYLAAVANGNRDFITAIDAQRRSVKLGRFSCYGSADDHFFFARLAALILDEAIPVAEPVAVDALTILTSAEEYYALSDPQLAQAQFLAGRIHALEKRLDQAMSCLQSAETRCREIPADIDISIDHLHILLAVGQQQRVERLLQDLIQKFAHDQAALQKLDPFLAEPLSDANSAFVASVNREGIELYNHGKFDEAIACFDRARTIFPKHVGIQLNIAQSLIGKIKVGIGDDDAVAECYRTLGVVAGLVDDQHPQFGRFSRLKAMMQTAVAS